MKKTFFQSCTQVRIYENSIRYSKSHVCFYFNATAECIFVYNIQIHIFDVNSSHSFLMYFIHVSLHEVDKIMCFYFEGTAK